MWKVTAVAALLLVSFSTSHAESEIHIKKVTRVIDISNQLVTITSSILFENVGKSAVSSYTLLFDENQSRHLSYIAASITAGKNKNNLQVTQQTGADGKVSWKVDLGSELKPGATSELLEVEAVFTHLYTLYPSEILQAERQLVLYKDNHYFYTPYLTKTQSTKVKLPSSGSIESFSKLKPASQTERNINYGPYENIVPLSYSKMQIHVENNAPFLTVSNLDRKIEISHWAGMISVEETIDVRHDGALLKGPFSRYEYQREPTNGISSVKSFRTKLPVSAQDIYYRDEIGNISTSNVKVTMNNVIAELRPRFPLFGGWKTHYVLGYYVPTQDYLFNDGNQYLLRMPFVDHIFDNSIIDEALVSIILPEGASNVRLRLPYSVNREKDQVHYTYLDTVGRPVIVLRKSNLVEQHIQDFEIHYNYNKLYMLQEPLLIVLALFCLCIVVIIYVRLDFSLTKNPLKESGMKIAGIVERILKHHDKRSHLYSQFDQAALKFKSSKDNGTYQSTLKKLHAEHKHETQAIADLVAKLKTEGSSADVLEKVNDLIRLDRTLKEQLQQQQVLVEKLVAGKINKQLYIDTDNNITKKKEDIAEKMNAITRSL
ncbi:Dolichyl-diphosphooligosaccharide--protein glycosyltransferase subunit 1-like protein [Leptotrombidium deliense]|uniref:Dolichyl-diphosphooligosaccharide--protein glycosyltransferase subunit 1 n=1 Tax=Leptotrombidium deliense TaxID=299467 RepID=A0A443SKZ8_9ACAR|nr:Dolichyl-diphosphooligosaccharide--protein glycosyltransferase subunit 1-like protein [Leptotrombidium deliense]